MCEGGFSSKEENRREFGEQRTKDNIYGKLLLQSRCNPLAKCYKRLILLFRIEL